MMPHHTLTSGVEHQRKVSHEVLCECRLGTTQQAASEPVGLPIVENGSPIYGGISCQLYGELQIPGERSVRKVKMQLSAKWEIRQMLDKAGFNIYVTMRLTCDFSDYIFRLRECMRHTLAIGHGYGEYTVSDGDF